MEEVGRIMQCLGVVIFMFSAFCSSSFHDKYKVPRSCTDKWESYILHDKEYILQNFPLSWENAKIICRGSHNGTLAVIDTAEKAEYLAEVLSESQFSVESVWVGARRASDLDPQGYRWFGGASLRRTAIDVLHGEDSYKDYGHFPLWLNRTRVPVPEGGADCVALDRVYHDKPVFLDLPCNLERAFICEKDALNRLPTVEVRSVKCKTGRYHVFSASLDWDQAAAHCVTKRMMLANIGTMKCLKKLGMVMLKSRPSIENAWIGAKGEQGSWKWLDSGTSIFTASALIDIDESKWPPVRDRTAMKQNGCLQLDRHSVHAPVFLESRCGRKMHFICYEGVPERRAMELGLAQSDDTYYYILMRQKLNWQQAADNCASMKGALANVDDNDILIQLLLLMGENKEKPVEHVWLSGVLNVTRDMSNNKVKFSWINPSNGKKIPDPKNTSYKDGFMAPWLDDDFSPENSCLNLDRQYHLSGLVYGLPCDIEQYSICMVRKTTTAADITKRKSSILPVLPEGLEAPQQISVEPLMETTINAAEALSLKRKDYV